MTTRSRLFAETDSDFMRSFAMSAGDSALAARAPRTRRQDGSGRPKRIVTAYECGACRNLAACAASSGGTDGVADIGMSTLD